MAPDLVAPLVDLPQVFTIIGAHSAEEVNQGKSWRFVAPIMGRISEEYTQRLAHDEARPSGVCGLA